MSMDAKCSHTFYAQNRNVLQTQSSEKPTSHVCACVRVCTCVYMCVHVSMRVHLRVWHFVLRHIRESHVQWEKNSEFMAQRQLCDNSTNLGFIVTRCGFCYFFLTWGKWNSTEHCGWATHRATLYWSSITWEGREKSIVRGRRENIPTFFHLLVFLWFNLFYNVKSHYRKKILLYLTWNYMPLQAAYAVFHPRKRFK